MQASNNQRMPAATEYKRLCAALTLAALSLSSVEARADALPAGFVYLRDVTPSILQDMRYATPNNFTGKRVTGYVSDECVLAKPVANALATVQLDLLGQALSLKVYDCYRPDRAVKDFLRWAKDPATDKTEKSYHPDIDKRQIVARGYVAARSTHSTGRAVDLTIVQGDRATDTVPPTTTVGACTAPIDERQQDTSVDMGTGFDCFHAHSHTRHPAIKGEARRWRDILVTAMTKRGFRNYAKEWWHFNYNAPGFRKRHDFVVPNRRKGEQPDAKQTTAE